MNDLAKTILVCYTQSTFDQLAADPEIAAAEETPETDHARYIAQLADRLVAGFKLVGCSAEIVRLPQRSPAPRDISKAAFAWRILDLKESNGRPIDMALCLDFPAWSLQHPNKVIWLTALPNFIVRGRLYVPQADEATPSNVLKVQRSDPQLENARAITSLLQSERRGLAEAKRLLAGSRPVAEDLARRGLQVEFNPLPADLAAPLDSLEWQKPLERLLKVLSA